jgi:hypothetical protein
MVLIEASAKPTWFRSDPRLVPFIFGRTRPASLAELDSLDASDEPHERLPPVLKWALAQIVAIEAHKIEGHDGAHSRKQACRGVV